MNKTLVVLAVIGALVLAQNSLDEPAEQEGPEGRKAIRGPLFHGGRGRHHRRGPPPPPYLRNVTKEARREYFEIVRNMSMTIAQQKQEINKWAEKYGVADQVAEFNANLTRLKEEVRRNVTQLISELPQAEQRISRVVDNEDQTPMQLFQALRNLTKENPPLYLVAKFAGEVFLRRPHGPRGGPGGRAGRRRPFGSGSDFERPDFEQDELESFAGRGGIKGKRDRGTKKSQD